MERSGQGKQSASRRQLKSFEKVANTDSACQTIAPSQLTDSRAIKATISFQLEGPFSSHAPNISVFKPTRPGQIECRDDIESLSKQRC